MLIGMPLASTMGLAGSPVKPMVIPVAAQSQRSGDHAQQQAEASGRQDAEALKPLADKAKAAATRCRSR
jgi:nitrate/nitrite transport system substrate-binding protein